MATEEKKKKVLISDECILCGTCVTHNPPDKEYFVLGSDKAEYHGEYREDVVEPAIDDCPTGAISVKEE